MSPNVLIIAAMEREIAPLVKGWRRSVHRQNQSEFLVFEKQSARIACGGIGAEHARRTTELLVGESIPDVLVSAGFAGALVAELKEGDVFVPAKVVDVASGADYSSNGIEGVLVSGSSVADSSAKAQLAARFRAQAIDMESAAVAQVARAKGISFAAVKAISDEVDFAMPPMDRFVDEEGNFRTSSLLAWAALRPGSWPALSRLGAASRKASAQLSFWLQNQIDKGFRDILIHQGTR